MDGVGLGAEVGVRDGDVAEDALDEDALLRWGVGLERDREDGLLGRRSPALSQARMRAVERKTRT